MTTLIRPFAYIGRRNRLEAQIGDQWVHLPVEDALDLMDDLRVDGGPMALGRAEMLELAIEDMRQAEGTR
jgi:hypothetical protein